MSTKKILIRRRSDIRHTYHQHVVATGLVCTSILCESYLEAKSTLWSINRCHFECVCVPSYGTELRSTLKCPKPNRLDGVTMHTHQISYDDTLALFNVCAVEFGCS